MEQIKQNLRQLKAVCVEAVVMLLLSVIPDKYLHRRAAEKQRYTTLKDITGEPIYEGDTVKHYYHPAHLHDYWMVCEIVWNRAGWGLKHIAHYDDENLTKRRHAHIIEHNDFIRSIWGSDIRTMKVLKPYELEKLNLKAA